MIDKRIMIEPQKCYQHRRGSNQSDRKEIIMADSNLTAQRLREVLSYNQETGVFTRNIATSNRVRKGVAAGRNNGNGYLRTSIDGYSYYAHRLAWFYKHGEWPKNHIDHIDGNRRNNAITNLRCVTHAQNHQNLGVRSTNKSGMTGVSWHAKAMKWNANIWKNGKRIYLGLFESVEDAASAYKRAKLNLHEIQPTLRNA